MAAIGNQYKIERGDCAWNVASKTLKAQGKKVTNSAIINEMERLAKLNGCQSIDEFNNKYFAKVGSVFIVEKKETPAPKKKSLLPDHVENQDTVARNDNTRVVRDTIVKTPDKIDPDTIKNHKKPKPQKLTPEMEIANINAMDNDVDKIIEYNKRHAKGNYIIIDKKTCTATVYNKDGKKLDSYEVLLGQTKGDDLASPYAKDASQRSYETVPGEFTFSAKAGTFGGLLYLGESRSTCDPDIEVRNDVPGSGGKKIVKDLKVFQAIHGTANPKVRNKYYNNGTLTDNRQSSGCVNIPVEDLNEIQNKYGIGVGSKCYILPEEKGNKLVLQKQKDGEIKFVTHYKDEVQNEKLARINDDLADKRIQKKLLAKQKAEQQELLAKEQKKEEFSILDPKTWFNFG